MREDNNPWHFIYINVLLTRGVLKPFWHLGLFNINSCSADGEAVVVDGGLRCLPPVRMTYLRSVSCCSGCDRECGGKVQQTPILWYFSLDEPFTAFFSPLDCIVCIFAPWGLGTTQNLAHLGWSVYHHLHLRRVMWLTEVTTVDQLELCRQDEKTSTASTCKPWQHLTSWCCHAWLNIPC